MTKRIQRSRSNFLIPEWHSLLMSLFAAEEQRQRKRMENKLKRSAQQLGYQLIPLGQTA